MIVNLYTDISFYFEKKTTLKTTKQHVTNTAAESHQRSPHGLLKVLILAALERRQAVNSLQKSEHIKEERSSWGTDSPGSHGNGSLLQ